MFNSNALSINEKGNLAIGNIDTTELASKYGTPLYVIDDDNIKSICKIYTNAIDRYYNKNGMVLYASKAFSTTHMCNLINKANMGLDVVSGGELYTALKAKFPTSKIYFHGNNKTLDELEMAVKNDVGRIVVDNVYELGLLDGLCAKLGKRASVLFRIKPGIDAHTHDFVKTGQIDSKFGFALENGEAMDAVEQVLNVKNLDFVGIHCHIGSQIFDLDPFVLAAEVMMNFAGDIKEKFNHEITELNLGGGFGIKYVDENDPADYDKYIEAVSKTVITVAKERGLNVPFMLMEPGRSIVGESGITLYTVGAIKDIPSICRYVFVDGGMADNPRYIMYESQYNAIVANKATQEKTELVTIAGKCCESGDVLAKDIMLQNAKSGDILAVLATGAYNYSMSSNYNRIPRPAVVAVSGGKDKLIVKRETYADIIRNDL